MAEFIQALRVAPLLQYALLTGLLASVACGVVGTYVVARRITYVAGGIAHCVLGGMGAAVYLRDVQGVTWLSPLHGATAAALLAAGIIGIVSLRFRQREDTIISAVWATGMAVGVIFIARTPGYQQDVMSYLFGNILMVSGEDLWLIAALDLVVVVVAAAFYRPFLALCFDEEFARTRGVRVEAFYLLLLVLTALTVVLLVTVVGIVLVIALLTLPVAAAGQFARRLWVMMLLATLLSMLLTSAGLAVSYAPDLPTGAVTIVLAAAAYGLAISAKGITRRMRRQRTRKAAVV
ncbi:MAG: iron chelate uptake ABC transporter family permease subunit [Planctomycetes bacterium]|jgi:zinc transport system permease protein|nr:metal ABC transporter permease [Phycisphaerae bacterium]NBB95440.1 iron chelate uptake ABC transporter family permease subunit [Planctomycetota bacterium]